jgi:hypothetical protein
MADRPADGGFRRAMLIGLGFSLLYILFEILRTKEELDPEYVGRILATFILPAIVAGFVAEGRLWSWRKILIVYIPLAIASLIFLLSRHQR